MNRLAGLAVAASLIAASHAWIPAHSINRAGVRPQNAKSLLMAIDYNDPVVAEEFAKVQPMSFEEMEEELNEKGIRVSQAMSAMDVKLMLVEVRLRFAGKLGDSKPKKRPTKFTSKFEEALWTKPAFEEYYTSLKEKDDHNAMNVVKEYLDDRKMAKVRYGKDYKAVIRQIEAALSAPPPVKSTTIEFSGFPANMGEAACKMTLESIGVVLEFSCTQDDDFPILKGKVTFEDIESAKKAVAQYDGMNMGMGTTLQLSSV
jgi:hypothetical protein